MDGHRPNALTRAFRHVRYRLKVFNDELVIGAVIVIALIAFMLPAMLVTIPAGHLGVKWKRFSGGTVLDETLPEGTSLIFPWDKVFVYDARLQKAEREFEVLTSDGLQLKVNLAWRFRVIPSVLPALHQHVGPNYQDVMLTPSIGARARDVIAVYHPEDIYTDHRLEIQDQISESVRYELNNFFAPMSKDIRQWIVLEDVLIRRIELPNDVEESIIRKNIARHEVERYALIVEKELRETERKRIEALGIRNFQEIVSQGMSDSYLRWRGIEATLELARSNNAKVVVVGNNGTGGLPLISISGDDAKKEEPRKQAKKETSDGKTDSSEADRIIAGNPDSRKQGTASDGEAKSDGKPVKESMRNEENAKEARLLDDKVPHVEGPVGR